MRLLNFGVVRGGGGELPARLLRIHDGLAEVLRRARPDMIAVERVFVAKDPRATITLGEGRGVALLAAARAVQAVGGPFRARLGGRVGGRSPLPQRIVEITPAEVKKAVAGNGAATKAQVQRMVQLQLGMRNPPQPADAADALAVAICAALRRNVGGWFDPAHHKSEGRSVETRSSRSDAQTLRRSDVARRLPAGRRPAAGVLETTLTRAKGSQKKPKEANRSTTPGPSHLRRSFCFRTLPLASVRFFWLTSA